MAMRRAAAAFDTAVPISYNLVGQRLGRKGLFTRQRIIDAAQKLLKRADAQFSMTAVAREAALSMTTIYLYFAELSDLMVALLEPVEAAAEESHLADLRERWDDAVLGERCLRFIRAYNAHWQDNVRLLQLRNQFADAGDARMTTQRVSAAKPLIEHILTQMEGSGRAPGFNPRAMSAILVTGIDRVMIIHASSITATTEMPGNYRDDVCIAQAKLLEIAIERARQGATLT